MTESRTPKILFLYGSTLMRRLQLLEAEVAGLHSGADVNVSPLEFAYSEYLSIGILMNFIILVQICGNKPISWKEL